jgi:acetyl esterase/lipase
MPKPRWPSKEFVKQCYEKLAKDWANLDVKRDINYAGTENPAQSLDLLIPRKRNTDILPVIVFIHGGAWSSGDKAPWLINLADYAASGNYLVASINYRLSDEAIWPNQIHDCQAAIRWIKGNAKTLQIDPYRIGIWGRSAGGHLVSMLGTSWENSAIDGKLGAYSNLSTRVTCVVDSFGPIDFNISYETASDTWKEKYRNGKGAEAKLIGGSLLEKQEAIASANPITYIDQEDPDFLVIHGDADPLVDYRHSEVFHKELVAGGVKSTLITVKGGGHGEGFGNVGQHIQNFFDHHLLGIEQEWQDMTVERK